MGEDVCLFDADRQARTPDEFLEGSLGVCSQGGTISGQHFSYENFPHLCLCTEVREVEQAAVASGVKIDTLFRSTEGVAQQQGEQNAEKCRGEDTITPFNTALDGKGIQGGAVILDSAFYILMEGDNHPQVLGGTSYSLQECEQPCPADQVERLGQVYEGHVQRVSLLGALLLQLP